MTGRDQVAADSSLSPTTAMANDPPLLASTTPSAVAPANAFIGHGCVLFLSSSRRPMLSPDVRQAVAGSSDMPPRAGHPQLRPGTRNHRTQHCD